jgi:4-hydroxybenzoate polyprenyltransferase
MKKVIAYLQLIRLPNLFTAISNVWAGMFIVNNGAIMLPQFIVASMASGSLYSGGIVLNDYFDRQSDKLYRPNRPLPAGKISPRTALFLGISLITIGVIVCSFLSPLAIGISGLIAVTVLLYDGFLKKWFIPAIIAMGLCRGLNWLLGSISGAEPMTNYFILLIPAGVMVYIALITAVSRLEEPRPKLRTAVKISISVIPLIDGIIVLSFGYHWQAGMVAALILPVIITGKLFEMT